MLTVFPLLIILILLLFLFYLLFKKEIISPSFICTALYSLSVFILLLYSNEWKVDLSLKTYAAIILALIPLAVGELFATKIAVHNSKKRKSFLYDRTESDLTDGIHVGKKLIAFALIFTVITAILYYREIKKIQANSAYAQSVYGQAYSFLMQVRWAKTLEGANVSYYVQQMYTICQAIANVFVYVILYNRVYGFKKIKRNFFMYAQIILFVITSFMTTGRATMLNFVIYTFFCWVILLAKKRNWHFNNNVKVIGKSIIAGAVALLLFYLAGLLTEKSLHYDNFFDNFANYFSSSIYGLNEYLVDPHRFSPNTNFFGIHTLSGIYKGLRKLGVKIPDDIVALEYIKVGKYLSNIYTPLRRYIQDFGWLGMMFIMFLMGYGYKRLIWRNKHQNSSGIYVIFTAYFIFPLVFISIEERLFMDVIQMRSIYMIIYLSLFYQYIVHHKLFTKKIGTL